VEAALDATAHEAFTEANTCKRKDLGMNDHERASLPRCAGVCGATSVALVVLAAWLLPDLADARRAITGADLAAQPFERLLVWLCAAVTLGCATWLWSVTAAVSLQAARGTAHAPVPGVPVALRRAVLAACGVALAGAPSPALATPGELHRDHTGPATAAVVRGLPLPDRATGALAGGGPSRERVVVVRPGDTLWSLARRDLPPTADDAAVTARWHRIYDLNRDVIGTDPDVIHPDQRLRLPRG
jgi:nucleoid-associated protein YgaU